MNEIQNKNLEKEELKKQRRFHILLVFVIFQTLCIVALLIAIIYKFIQIGSSM